MVNSGQKKTLLCRVCNKVFKTEVYCIRHIRYHSDPPEKPTCDIYSTSFEFQSALLKHITLHDCNIGVCVTFSCL